MVVLRCDVIGCFQPAVRVLRDQGGNGDCLCEQHWECIMLVTPERASQYTRTGIDRSQEPTADEYSRESIISSALNEEEATVGTAGNPDPRQRKCSCAPLIPQPH